MWRTVLSAALPLTLFAVLGQADEQFNCPNNGKPKVGADGQPIQCLPGQSSELICGTGHACFFSGLNYQCCPTNDDESNGDTHGHQANSPSSSSNHHHDHHNEQKHEEHNHHDKEVIDEEHLNNSAECPDDTFIVLSQTSLPIPCNPRTNPCPQKSMFCNKYSPIPVCCESISTKKIHQPAGEKSKSQLPALLPLISTPLESNPLQQARFAPENPRSTGQADNEGGITQQESSQPATEIRTTTIVNHDMGMDGECTANSILVLSDDGKSIECGRNRRCPLDSLLCHKNNNGRSYCCQIVPHDEVDRTHISSTTVAPTTAIVDDKRQILGKLKQQEEELARLQLAGEGPRSPLSPAGNVIDVAGGSPPSVQPPGEQIAAKQATFADNESAAIPTFQSQNNGSPGSGSADSLHAVAHAAKTHDRDGVNAAAAKIGELNADVKAFESADDKPAAVTQDVSKIEYQPHTQGGYAVLRKLERGDAQNSHSSLANDREERKRLAQRFLLDQIKDGWPYDDKFYRGENVIVMNRGTRPAAIVHFPN